MTKYLYEQKRQMDTTQPIGDTATSMSAEAQAAYPALNAGTPLTDYDGKIGFAGGGFKDGDPGDSFDQVSQVQTEQLIGDKSSQSAEVERSYTEFSDLT